MTKSTDWKLETKMVRAGFYGCQETGAISPPIYQAVNYKVDNVDEGADRCRSFDNGYIYTRLGSPTQTILEKKIAALENGESALAFSTGVAAITATLMCILKQGDHVIADGTVYSATNYFLSTIMQNYGIETTFVDCSNSSAVEAAIRKNTKIIYFETPANPTVKLVNLKEMVSIGKANNILTIVDSTFASPYLQRPLNIGVDVVGGIVISKKELIDKIRDQTLKNVGGVISPFDAWLLLRGLKTLHLRMERHCKNALEVAKFLEGHPKVDKVFYPGLTSHPQHKLACEQMDDFGGMIAFELKGGFEAGKTLMNNLKLCWLAVSLGDTDTLIQHPASMTHVYIPEEEKLKAGITDGLVRLSVGIENVEDIIKDLEQGLENI
jgi:methionine-gamma-lyase